MSIILSLVQLITILTVCFYEYKSRSISIFMWATLLIMFGIPHFLSGITGIYLLNNSVMDKASIFVIMFNLIYLITKIIIDSVMKNKIKSNSIEEKLNYTLLSRDKLMLILFFIILLFSLLIILWVSQSYFGGISKSSWGNFYLLNKELGFTSPVKYADFLFFASAGVILVFKSIRCYHLYYICFLLIAFYSAITNNRITILPAFMALIIPVIFSNKQRISIKKVLYFFSMAIVVIYSVYLLRLVRFSGGIYNFVSSFDFLQANSLILEMLLTGDGELGLRNAFYYFIYINNNFPGFNEGSTYIRLLLIGIPTMLAQGIKPQDFAITMGSAYTNNISNTSYSMHPTLYGDCFANFWWFGVFLAVFWAVFSYLIGILVNRKNYVVKYMLLVLFGSVFIIAGRGSVYNGFFIGFESSIIIGIFYLLTRLRFKLNR